MTTILYFSPTGNTAYLANQLAEVLKSDNVLALEKTDYKAIPKSDQLVFMYSIHAFNAPKIVREYVKNLPEGLATHVHFVAVGCNDIWINHGATKDLNKYLSAKGYTIGVELIMAMPLTLVMSFPETLISEQIEGANELIEKVAKQITNKDKSRLNPAFKTKVIQTLGRLEPGAAKLFGLELHAKKSCSSCGLCVRECPQKNIKMTDAGKIKFGFNCMMCMRCIYQCPEKAISPYISRFVPIKNGYNINNYLKKES